MSAIICSFYTASGSTCALGRMWYWDFSEHFGPLWMTKTGRVCANQDPPAKVWDAFYDWLETKFGPLGWREGEREIKKAIADGRLTVHRHKA